MGSMKVRVSDKDVDDEIYRQRRRFRYDVRRSMVRHEEIEALMNRKTSPLDLEGAVLVAIERLNTTARRLRHDTGAVNWK